MSTPCAHHTITIPYLRLSSFLVLRALEESSSIFRLGFELSYWICLFGFSVCLTCLANCLALLCLPVVDCRVLLADSSWENIRAARMSGLPTFFGNPTSQHAEAHLDLVGLGHLLALTPSAELNALACMHFRHDFPGNRRFTLPTSADGRRSDKHRSSDEVRGLPLGGQPLSFPQFASRLARGDEVRSTTLTQAFDWNAYNALYGRRATLLLARAPNGWLHIATQPLSFTPGTGWTLMALIESEEPASEPSAQEANAAI